jgi:hypothetical protein
MCLSADFTAASMTCDPACQLTVAPRPIEMVRLFQDVAHERFELWLLAPDRRRAGYSRVLVRHAHEHLTERHIAFSILFAYEPRIYQRSGYKLMQNATHFIEPDGTPRTLVHRGSMYAEFSQTRWPNQLLDLHGRTV